MLVQQPSIVSVPLQLVHQQGLLACVASCHNNAACSKLKQNGKTRSAKPRLQLGALSLKQQQHAERKKPANGRSSGRRPTRYRLCLPDKPAARIGRWPL